MSSNIAFEGEQIEDIVLEAEPVPNKKSRAIISESKKTVSWYGHAPLRY